jgi:hypothetical protein
MEKIVLFAFLITILSEVFIILLIQKPRNFWNWILTIIFINSFTHPVVMYFLHVKNSSYFLAELGVFIIESILYKIILKLNWKKAILLSGIANIFSILLGLIIRLILTAL